LFIGVQIRDGAGKCVAHIAHALVRLGRAFGGVIGAFGRVIGAGQRLASAVIGCQRSLVGRAKRRFVLLLCGACLVQRLFGLVQSLALLIGFGGDLVEFSAYGIDRLSHVLLGGASSANQGTHHY